VLEFTCFLGFLCFLNYTLVKPSVGRSVVMAALGALMLLMGVSRIYQGQHWFSDVMGAYLLGSLWLALSIKFYRWGKKKFFVRQPVAPKSRPSRPQPREHEPPWPEPFLRHRRRPRRAGRNAGRAARAFTESKPVQFLARFGYVVRRALSGAGIAGSIPRCATAARRSRPRTRSG
jgi:hypothetical protein